MNYDRSKLIARQQMDVADKCVIMADRMRLLTYHPHTLYPNTHLA